MKGPPARLYCVRCDGSGCEACGGRGWTPITSCPKKMVTDETRHFLDGARFTEEKLPPVGGGYLDQTESFMQALRFFRDEESRIKASDGSSS